MKTYIALLRGINVGGRNKIKMADLRMMLQKMDFDEVQTYIQSGNVIFKSAHKNTSILEQEIKSNIATTFGLQVPVLVKDRTDLVSILKESPFTNPVDIESNRIYYVLLKNKLQDGYSTNLDQQNYPNELFVITENCVYLNCLKGAGKAKLTNALIEKKLKVEATTRNYKTMLKLIELSL